MNDDNGHEGFYEETRDASPANLLVRIESLLLLSKYGIDKHESRTFESGGYKWRVIIYPDGYNGENDNVSVLLSIAETDCLPVGFEVNAIFAFFVYNHSMDNYLCFRGRTHRFNAVIPKWGFSKLMCKKRLIDPREGFVVDDCCVFGAEVYVIKTQPLNDCLSLVKHTDIVKRDWKIWDFSKLGDVWNSEYFEVGGCKWKVEMYPKGYSCSKDRHISIFVECMDANNFAPHQKLKAEVSMLINSKLNHTLHSKKFSHWFTSSGPNRGYYEFVAIGEMSIEGFVVDDCCCLGIEISIQAVVGDAPKLI